MYKLILLYLANYITAPNYDNIIDCSINTKNIRIRGLGENSGHVMSYNFRIIKNMYTFSIHNKISSINVGYLHKSYYYYVFK